MKKFLLIFLLVTNVFLWSNDFNGWKKTSTEHFTFIFEDFDKDTAFELASYGEEIYDKVGSFFQYYPDHINVYINSRIDTPNGMFYPIPGSIVLYPVFPHQSSHSTLGNSWLYELLLHEVVHYINLEKPVGFFGVLSYLFGKDVAAANGAFLPAWMVEGIAVYLETEMTDGGRGRNAYFKSIWKAAFYEKKYPSFYQLAYSSSFPPYDRIYSWGYVFTDYLLHRFGEDIFFKVYNRYAKFPFFGPYGAFKRETGSSLKDAYEDFLSENEQEYEVLFAQDWPDRSKISQEGIADYYHPLLSDIGIVSYKRSQKGPSAIVSIDRETGHESRILETSLIDSTSFSIDASGSTIVFSASDYFLYNSFGDAIYAQLFLYEQGNAKKLATGHSLLQPSISPDGGKIAAVKREGPYSILVSVDHQSGEVQNLFDEPGINVMNPVFSHDGNQLLFIVNNKGEQDIFTLSWNKPDDYRPLFTTKNVMEYHPRFVNDHTISFVSDRENHLSLYTYNLKTGLMEKILNDPVGIADAIVTEDKVFYQSYRTDGYEIFRGEVNQVEQTDYIVEKNPIAFSEPNEIFPIENHTDLSVPYLWLPKPYAQFTLTEDILWGLGVALFAGSYSQSSTWLLDFNFLPSPLQFDVDFSYERQLGSLNAAYSISQYYSENSVNSEVSWQQRTRQNLSISYPLVESMNFKWRHILSNYFYISHLLEMTSPDPFSFVDSFQLESANYIFTGLGFTLSDYKLNNGSAALFGGLSIRNSLEVSLQLPVFSSEELSLRLKQSGSVTLPLSERGTNIQLGWEGAYHNGGLSSQSVSARGWNARTVLNSDLSFNYSAGLQLPIALVDWGMPLGFNIQSLATTINAEGVTHLNWSGSSYSEFYASLEFIGTYGYNYGAIPAGAGFSLKFYPEVDWEIYFFLSYNSLNSTLY